MKASYRFLSLFLVLALMFSCSACASGTGTAAGAEEAGQEATGEEAAGEGLSAVEESTTRLFLSLTEKTSKSLAFPLTEEQAAQEMLEKEYIDNWYTCFAAGAVLVSIPIAILFLRMQKYYVNGLSGGVKG